MNLIEAETIGISTSRSMVSHVSKSNISRQDWGKAELLHGYSTRVRALGKGSWNASASQSSPSSSIVAGVLNSHAINSLTSVKVPETKPSKIIDTTESKIDSNVSDGTAGQ